MIKGCLQTLFNFFIFLWLCLLTIFVLWGTPSKLMENVAIPPELLGFVEEAMDKMDEGELFSPEMKRLADSVKEKIEDAKLRQAGESVTIK